MAEFLPKEMLLRAIDSAPYRTCWNCLTTGYIDRVTRVCANCTREKNDWTD